jgi:hypothetical protein
MSESTSKYVKVGQIIRNEKDGKVYKQLVLSKEFLENAKELIQLAYLDKNGGRRFSIYEPFEGAPDYVEANIVVKKA